MMPTLSEAYAVGRAAGEQALRSGLTTSMRETFAFLRICYPATAHLDHAADILRLDRERMANPPDPCKYPETKGWPDLVREERRGFLDACRGDEVMMAYHYSWYFYTTRRLNTRHVGAAPAPAECSAAYLPDSTEGGPLYGRNWDVPLTEWAYHLLEPPRTAADGKRRMWAKGVSCSVLLDEEPAEIFPIDPWALLPVECTEHVPDAVAFLSRYREFWGPTNLILVDRHLESVALEKANVRLGVRPSEHGASAVTALSFRVPEMKAYKDEKDLLSLERRGWTKDSCDWKYWRAHDVRYARLMELMAAASKRTGTLQDMADIMTDHSEPYPSRLCGTGQTVDPVVIPPERAEWTACSHSEVLEGPNRRILFYRVEGKTPCYETPPFLIPGEGVEVKPEWRAGTRPLPPPTGTPRPKIERDYPNVRMMF